MFNKNQPRDKDGKFSDIPDYIQKSIKQNTSDETGAGVDSLMRKAQEAGPEVDKLANDIAKRTVGTVTPINYKTRESILRKVKDEYNGDIDQVKDSVRNTIILEDSKDVERVLSEFEKHPGTIRIKRQDSAKDPLGYSGAIVNFRAKNGLQCEIQVNTAKMIYAKDHHAKLIIGESKFNEIAKATGQPSGQGHMYYENWRVLDPMKKKKDRAGIEGLSKKYYSFFL